MHENTKLAEVVDTVKELKEAFIADTGLATGSNVFYSSIIIIFNFLS